MEVTLKAGDSLNIPEGCKAVIKDNVVVFEREEKEEVQDFKDGDIVILCGRTKKDRHPFIFKGEDDGGRQNFYIGIDFKNVLRTFCDDEYYDARRLHHATEEEKQLLFDKMKEQGLLWNAEEKRVEKIRWRAKEGGDYYFIDIDLTVKSIDDTYSTFDNKLWDTLNYFRTKEQAEEAARRVRETLRKYHEEIGE